MTAIDHLGAQKYISLTTFRRDGSAVPTPVWQVRDGDRLLVITDAASGKAKRIRNDGRVTIAPCDMRGRVNGDVHDARARLLDASETAVVLEKIEKKYGFMAKAIAWGERLRRRSAPSERVGIEITLV